MSKVVVRASTEDASKAAIAMQQLGACEEAGFELEAYLWLYWTSEDSPAMQVETALSVCHGYPVKRLWLDCEEESRFTPEQTAALIRQAVMACDDAKMPTGIYTGKWIWPKLVGETTEFAHLPLWLADYDDNPSMAGWQPWAGWTDLTMKQFSGGNREDWNIY